METRRKLVPLGLPILTSHSANTTFFFLNICLYSHLIFATITEHLQSFLESKSNCKLKNKGLN